MDEFLLLVRSPYPAKQMPPPAPLGPPLPLWHKWVDRLKADGSLVALPSYLDDTGRILTRGQAIAEGPYLEGAEAIDGLLLIQVTDYEAATRIAQGCPVLAVGGTVEVRRAL